MEAGAKYEASLPAIGRCVVHVLSVDSELTLPVRAEVYSQSLGKVVMRLDPKDPLVNIRRRVTC